jgi:hypothetical protein
MKSTAIVVLLSSSKKENGSFFDGAFSSLFLAEYFVAEKGDPDREYTYHNVPFFTKLSLEEDDE